MSSAAMIEKVSGRAIYAVMSFGGFFLGMGVRRRERRLVNTKKGGNVVNLDKKLLEVRRTMIVVRSYGRKVDRDYKTPSY
jgi:hypothetical protein